MKISLWYKNYINNYYYKLAKKNNLRSRSWYKLQQIDIKEKLFKPGMIVLDLGSYPGGWSQYTINKILPKGILISCDLLNMNFLNKVIFIKIDITSIYFINKIKKILDKNKFDIIISDICPNVTGIIYKDSSNYQYLLEKQLNICINLLKYNGTFITKFYLNNYLISFYKKLNLFFKKVKIFKPNTSLDKSKENYFIAKNFFIR